MPELPEVETIVRGLFARVMNKKIEKAELRYEKLFRDCSGKILDQPRREGFLKKIENKRITNITRRGKYILFHLFCHKP